jgi:hypothetical protein
MIQLTKSKIIGLIIFVGFICSLIISIINTNKYDNYRILENGRFEHSIIRTDIANYWRQADKFKYDLENGKNFSSAGLDHKDSYLYPRIIGFYHFIFNKNINNSNGFININNFKLGIPIINLIIFYLSLIFFSKKISLIFKNQRIIYFTILFLSLEPTLTQFHSSYWTESIYLSCILIIFGLLLKPDKKIFINFFIGFLIGLSFLQRSVSLYLIIPISIYYFYNFKKSVFIPLFSCFLGNLIVILFLGYSNYLKNEKFLIIPDDQKDGPYYLMAHQLNKETSQEKYQKRDIWIKENNLDIKNKFDKKKILDYQNEYFKEALKNNFAYFLFIHFKKSIQSQLLDPFFVNNAYKQDKTIKNYWEKNFYLYKYTIPYSFFIYFICMLGFIKITLKEKNYKLSLLIFIFVIYYTSILGWVGWNRYLVPNLIFLSIFFGVGFDSLIKYVNIKK